VVLTQWYDSGGIIGAIFVGIVVMLALVVLLEQWLASSELPNLAALERKLDEPDHGLTLTRRELPGAEPIR
jgi:hypothetical protein